MIKIEKLTKDYGGGNGIFDVNIEIKRGECFGYVGTNGSGKTTTIRNIMGFIRPDSGTVTVKGMDAWEKATEIKKYISYIPGEIAFPPLSTGMDFLKKQAEYLKIKDPGYMNSLLKAFKLDPSADLSRMSKGMKQKTAIIAALMSDAEILILDEPTTGLDPLMREVFMDIMEREKKRGKTIFMSGHIFEEIEELCDRVAFIKDGHIVDVVDIKQMEDEHKTVYSVGFNDKEEYKKVLNTEQNHRLQSHDDNVCELKLGIERNAVNELFAMLKDYSVKYINEETYDLETYFDRKYIPAKGGR